MATRLGIVVSHPIQYFSPWFRYLAERMPIEVCYAHKAGVDEQAAAGFGVGFEWDIPLLEGYPYRWLTNRAHTPGLSHFGGLDTPELFGLIDARRYHAVLVFGWAYRSSLQALAACALAGVPALMRGDSQLTTQRGMLKRLIKYLPYRILLPRLAAHLWVGARNRAYLEQYGVPASRLFFAPHFVDGERFARQAAAARATGKNRALRAAYGIPADAFVLLYVGKFTSIKRPEDAVLGLIRALELAPDLPLHLLMVGDGPHRGQLATLARACAGRVHFAGFRNQAELPAVYAAGDALVLPGDETWGLVVNEAMACGLPVLVSSAAGCGPDMVRSGRTGYVYQHGSIDMLAQRLLDLRQVLAEKQEAVTQALVEQTARYSMATATAGLEAALRHCVNVADIRS